MSGAKNSSANPNVRPVTAGLIALVADHDGLWRGTPTELHRALVAYEGPDAGNDWPRSARAAATAVEGSADRLFDLGVEVRRPWGKGIRRIVLERTAPTVHLAPAAGIPVRDPAKLLLDLRAVLRAHGRDADVEAALRGTEGRPRVALYALAELLAGTA